MKTLKQLINCHNEIKIYGIKTNSREIRKGDLFVCTNRQTMDRHLFIDDAIKKGAHAVIVQKDVGKKDVPIIKVNNPNAILPKICAKFYDYPDKNLELIAITGTNGKTTTALIIQDLIGNDLCGYIGTNGIICHQFKEKIKNTTPDIDKLYAYFKRLQQSNCHYISMEVSSEALFYKRIANLKFKVGIITNITEDHLNIHKTLQNYVKSKQKLLNYIDDSGTLILNCDDKYYKKTQKKFKGKILTYGKHKANLQIIKIHEKINQTQIKLKYQNKIYNIISPLKGECNVYNLCAAILSLLSLGYDINNIIQNIPKIKTPKGRMEFLDFHQNYYIILDYAHTPDAFIKIYAFLKKVKKQRIITVSGSAGAREKEKRPLMGQIILDNSDYVIFTMDDPRWENVEQIIDDLVQKSTKDNYERIINRQNAIIKALLIAQKNDIVLIAGKGDDNYMAIHDDYLPYSDYHVIQNFFQKKQQL